MSDYGVTDAGFVAKSLEDILAEVESDEKIAFGASIDLAPQSSFGQLNGIMAERLAELWALGEAVYAAFHPDTASGTALVDLCALTGTAQAPPTLTKVIATCCGTVGTVLTSGRVASVDVLGYRFESVAAGTIAAVSAWASGTAYASGDRRTNSGKVWQCTGAGTSAGSGGPSGAVGATVTDNTVTWRCIGTGAGAVDLQFNAVAGGPLNANAGTLSHIETPVAGWSTVYNVTDHYYLGTNLDSDAALRLKRERELRAQGNAAAAAIRQSVLAVDGVYGCYVFENCTDTTDADGLPPHSVEVVVQGGADADIRAAIFASVAGGIQTAGGVSGTFVDSQLVGHTVKFSRPTEVPVYVTIDVTTEPLQFPSDGADQIKASLVTYGAAHYTNGTDVVSAALLAQAFGVVGVADGALPKVGTAPSPSSTATLVMTLRQIAILDTARIVVNVS